MKQNTKTKKTAFYDKYHEKNDDYFEVINDNNFTYFYIQDALRYIFTKIDPHKVLDIGCGVGTLGFYLSAKGADVVGYDVSPRAISIANHYKEVSNNLKIEFRNKDVQKEKFDSNFDLVICTEVIEHLEQDDMMLSTIHKVLKKNGYLLLSTPSVNAPLYRLGFLRNFDRQVGHLRRYNLNSLAKQMENAGFSVQKSYKVEGILRNSLFTLPLVGNLIRLIKGPLIGIFHSIDMLSAKAFGESDLIIVARKN